jgi:hypothetical protein
MRSFRGVCRTAILAGALSLGWAVWVDAGPRDILAERLVFIYVADPNAAPGTPYIRTATQRLDNALILQGRELESPGMFWDERDRDTGPLRGTGLRPRPGVGESRLRLRRMHMLVRSLLHDPGRDGDARMQEIAAHIVQFGDPDKVVRINIIDDLTTGIYQTMQVPTDAGQQTTYVASHLYEADVDADRQIAITCAVHYPSDPVVQGVIALGASDLTYDPQFSNRRTGPALARACLLHELMHTQDASDVMNEVYSPLHYGRDGTHYLTEAIPNRSMAYCEGIADAMSFLYLPSEQRHAYEWFSNEGEILVEMDPRNGATGPPTVPAGIDRVMWLPTRIWDMQPRPQPLYDDGDYACYRIADMPPDVLAQNETVIAMILTAFAQHRSEARFIERMARANQELNAVTTSHLATLYNVLCESGDLLPLALTDYFVGGPQQLTLEQLRQFMGLQNLPGHPFNAVCQRYIQRRPSLVQHLQSTGSVERDIERIATETAIAAP